MKHTQKKDGMDKKPRQSTKDPKRQESGKKYYEIDMRKLRENILEDKQYCASLYTDSSIYSTISSVGNFTLSNFSCTDTSWEFMKLLY